MRVALKDNKAAEIICNNHYKYSFDYDYCAEQIADMLVQDFGMGAYSGPLHQNIDPDTTINDVVDYICQNILGRTEGPCSVPVEVFEAFMELELTLAREDEDYEDEAAWARCESRLA